MDKKFWATSLTLSGAIIGAGILGLPYVFSKSGFLVGVFWLVFLGLITLYINLCLGEITLRTKKIHQIPGYAGLYLGKNGKKIMMLIKIFGIYAALLAYLIGEGQSFSILFFGNLNYSVFFAVGFWFVMTLFLREGLEGLKKIESRGILLVTAIILFMFFYFVDDVSIGNLSYIDYNGFFFPFGVVLFAVLGFSAIPEMRIEIMKKEKLMRKAIILGTLIPIVLYFIFSLTFLGVFGKNVSQVATISSDSFIPVLGIFTMMAAYFVLSFSLLDVFVYDLKKNPHVLTYVSLVPLILYLIVSFFNMASFVNIIGIGGVITGGFTIILIMLIHMKSKKKGNRKPEFSVPMNWLIFWILTLIFLAGIFLELLHGFL
ncbi:amino acid permease [Candidatus Pacearchaeota archaeon]|nr:amino acid permease [Candidatus Pacearchaeota archaeon]